MQLDRDDGGGALFMEEALSGVERHKHSAILEAICRFQNADHVKCSMSYLDVATQRRLEKLRGTFAYDYIIGVLREVGAISLKPGGIA